MAKLALCLALAPVAAGFVAPSAAPAGTALAADRAIIGDDGIQAPVGYFDPLKLAEKVNDKTLLWFRAAEIKHCRVAMAAFAGCVVTGLGVHWPGAIDMSGTPGKVRLTSPKNLALEDKYDAATLKKKRD